LLVGSIFLAIGSIRNVRLEIIKNTTESWNISENLTEGNTYVLDIRSSDLWRDYYTEGGFEEPQPVGMVIISPDEGETKLQAFFLARLPAWPYKSTFPIIVYVEYGTVDSDSLDVDESYPQVRFTAKQGGYYTASVIEETLNWTTGPPREMVFYREVFQNQNSYTILLQSSGVVCLFTGIIISVWGVRATKKIRIREKKKVKKQSKN
jgi:hypothetical protein